MFFFPIIILKFHNLTPYHSKENVKNVPSYGNHSKKLQSFNREVANSHIATSLLFELQQQLHLPVVPWFDWFSHVFGQADLR